MVSRPQNIRRYDICSKKVNNSTLLYFENLNLVHPRFVKFGKQTERGGGGKVDSC